MTERTPPTNGYIRFPPGRQNILIPSRPRSAISIGMSLYTASQPRAVIAQNLLWLATMTAGAWILPGPRESWSPTTEQAALGELSLQWEKVVGRAVDAYAIYERPQAHRAALTMILCAGRKSVLVRVRSNPDELRQECLISAAAQQRQAASFGVPRMLGRGEAAGWHWIAYEAMATRPHRPARALQAVGYSEISTLVEAVVERPAHVSDHWRGAHRDLTPWNLRRSRGRTWLIDWEDAGWAPPEADRVYSRAIRAATRRGAVRALDLTPAEHEAAEYWVVELDRRPIESGQTLNHRLKLALDRGVQPTPS